MHEFSDPALQVSISLAAGSVVLRHRHLELTFQGRWGIGTEADARVFGRAEGPGYGGRAALHLAAQGNGLAASLWTNAGERIFGPLVLQPRACMLPPPTLPPPAAWPAAAA